MKKSKERNEPLTFRRWNVEERKEEEITKERSRKKITMKKVRRWFSLLRRQLHREREKVSEPQRVRVRTLPNKQTTQKNWVFEFIGTHTQSHLTLTIFSSSFLNQTAWWIRQLWTQKILLLDHQHLPLSQMIMRKRLNATAATSIFSLLLAKTSS